MFLGLQWYWWLLIAVGVVVSIPVKIRFLMWWSERRREREKDWFGEWGEDE